MLLGSCLKLCEDKRARLAGLELAQAQMAMPPLACRRPPEDQQRPETPAIVVIPFACFGANQPGGPHAGTDPQSQKTPKPQPLTAI